MRRRNRGEAQSVARQVVEVRESGLDKPECGAGGVTGQGQGEQHSSDGDYMQY